MRRKQRTREHVIADLSVNYLERFVLLQGHTTERFTHDYGYDLALYTYNEQGEAENGVVYLQMKATEKLLSSGDGNGFRFQLSVRDLLLWTEEISPVLLVVYEAESNAAYWLSIQDMFSAATLPEKQATVTVTIPYVNGVNEASIEQFRQLKTNALLKLKGQSDDA